MSASPPADRSGHPPRDDRKTAGIAAGGLLTAIPVSDFETARKILRDKNARQAGFLAETVGRITSLAHPPILYLHGEAHRRQRAATARFFAPRVVATRYRAVMDQTTATLIARFQQARGCDLDEMALEMAVTVAADIVG